MNKDELESLCVKIRGCLDEWYADGTLNNLDGSEMSNFPSGCCGFVTECLAVILYKLTGEVPNQVSAECNTSHSNYNKLAANSHLWIELNGINIDLTGDQFNDHCINIPPVFVSTSPHPLSSKMKTETKPAYVIGLTKPLTGNDVAQLSLIRLLRKELSLY
ncbi:hypothetical protein [Citrobacter sp. Igbk 16]|uniref:hypothetical protein n=1 Tax=Citrobacter sp. Igbk 16 TaxID=2963958 RepID=UPI0023029DF4|nr:hypothetical protein [Citrobacter sp. Igbk 16]MDA8515625.1 hypothetical protein [Citrobacter sp. Igbk 16]